MDTKRVVCEIITGEEARKDAQMLVRQLYREQGYGVGENGIAAYLTEPHAATFGSRLNGILYATVSVVSDNTDGLPMDAIYREELSSLRKAGKRLAEVVQLAADHDLYRRAAGGADSLFIAAPLFATILSYAEYKKIDYLCIAVNPKHDNFYRLIGFQKIGALKHHPSVDAPAIARIFNVSEWNKHGIVASMLSKEILRHRPGVELFAGM